MGIQLTGMASGLDTNSMVENLMSVQRLKVDAIKKEKIRMQWKKEVWKDMNTKLYDFYKNSLFKFKSAATYSQNKVNSSNSSVVSVSNSASAVKGSHSLEITNMAKGSFLTGDEVTDLNGDKAKSTTKMSELMALSGDVTLSLKTGGSEDFSATQEVTITADDTIDDVKNKINALGLDMNVSYDENYGRLFFSSTETGADVELGISAGVDGSGNTEAVDLLGKLGFTTSKVDINGTKYDAVTGSVGEDAEFIYNGTTLTSSSNEVSVNGLDFEILADTGTSTITVAQDTDAIYDAVKSFVEGYNELMKEINEKVGADSARGFDPLTDDEKEGMSESEIESWEEKIKDSLLRRDDILGAIGNDLRSIISGSKGVDTDSLDYKYLADLGIVTGDYTQKGELHIYGDEDDDEYSTKDNKLRDAIDKNPDGIKDFFVALGSELYDKMRDRMKTSTLSSALTFYNNKYMDKEIKNFDKEIDELEDRLSVVEERYYAQFTAMEKAMTESNSTGNWLASQLQSM